MLKPGTSQRTRAGNIFRIGEDNRPRKVWLPSGVADSYLAVVYFLIYQVANGTGSGAGYAYQAESFPTRVRGTAVGFLGAMMAGF